MCGRSGKPGLEGPLRITRLEGVDEIMQPKNATGVQDGGDPLDREHLPEVREVVQGIPGIDDIRRFPLCS
jgi:hypothetical protein